MRDEITPIVDSQRARMCRDAKTGFISRSYANNAEKNTEKAKEIVIVL
jgi:hypothetical protein